MPPTVRSKARPWPARWLASAAIAAPFTWATAPAAGDTYAADWLQVSGVNAAEVHSTPFGGAMVARVPDGTLLRNKGCVGSGSQRWCEVDTLDGKSAGWVYGRFLQAPAEGGP